MTSTNSSLQLRYEAASDVDVVSDIALSVMINDIIKKQVPMPMPESINFSRLARLRDGRVVGGLVGNAKWTAVHLSHLAVHPDFRGRGIGTALMKWVEDMARTDFRCNQVHVSVLSWQPQRFFAKLGYAPQWTVQNHPRGHATHHLAKEWALASRGEPAVGYGGAAADVTLEDWDVEAATAQLETWLCADAEQHGVPNVLPMKKQTFGLKALHPDGSLAATSIYYIYWNRLHVHILTVIGNGKSRGVGTAVLRKYDEIARERGCDHISLYTASWQARPFYEKNGFVCVATQKDLPAGYERYALHRDVPKIA